MGLGLRVYGFGVWGFGCWGLGFRVWGFRVHGFDVRAAQNIFQNIFHAFPQVRKQKVAMDPTVLEYYYYSHLTYLLLLLLPLLMTIASTTVIARPLLLMTWTLCPLTTQAGGTHPDHGLLRASGTSHALPPAC